MSEYPVIDPKTLTPLRIIQAELAKNPHYLDLSNCPYSPELKAFLAFLVPKTGDVAPQNPKKSSFLGQNKDKWTVLEGEAAQLYDDLRDFSQLIKDGDVAERMSYFRTATSLLEKIVGINERAVGLKHIHDFQQTVLAAFDAELSPDLRTRVIERLQASIDEETTKHE